MPASSGGSTSDFWGYFLDHLLDFATSGCVLKQPFVPLLSFVLYLNRFLGCIVNVFLLIPSFSFFFFFFLVCIWDRPCHVTQTGLDSASSCLSVLSAGTHYLTWLLPSACCVGPQPPFPLHAPFWDPSPMNGHLSSFLGSSGSDCCLNLLTGPWGCILLGFVSRRTLARSQVCLPLTECCPTPPRAPAAWENQGAE